MTNYEANKYHLKLYASHTMQQFLLYRETEEFCPLDELKTTDARPCRYRLHKYYLYNIIYISVKEKFDINQLKFKSTSVNIIC